MFTRLKNEFKAKVRRTIKKVKEFVADPPLDVVGVGVMSQLVGRTALYGAFGVSFAAMHLPVQAALFFGVILVDVFIHIEVLAALRRLMRYEVEREIMGSMGFSIMPAE